MSTASVPLPNWINYGLIPILNLIVAFLISGLVVWFIGESPLDALVLLLQGALGSGEGIGFTLYYATSFIFTGLSVAVAIHAGLFNIGSEGQAYVGGLGCALVALALDRYVPWYVTMPFADDRARPSPRRARNRRGPFRRGEGTGRNPSEDGSETGDARQIRRLRRCGSPE